MKGFLEDLKHLRGKFYLSSGICGTCLAVYNNNLVKKLAKIQRLMNIGVIGAYRTTSADEVGVIAELSPRELSLKKEKVKKKYQIGFFGENGKRNERMNHIKRGPL